MDIKISNNILVGHKQRPIIVAEISGNHEGSKKKFLEHIVRAKKAGADMVKIQTYEASDITIKSYKKNFLVSEGIWKKKALWDLYEEAHTPFSWHADAFRLGRKLKIPIFSTPFSERSLNFLSKFNPPIYKIASFEITDVSLIKSIAQKNKPIIISTGLSNFSEIDNAIKIVKKYHKKIIILYCVSGYPTPEKESNISTVITFQKKYKNFLIGISDHTNDINSSLAAVALGAKVIEKHFKISDKIKSLDSKFSINFNQLKELKIKSEKIFFTLGKPKLKIKNSEKKIFFLRRSIFAKKDVFVNNRLTKKNIITKRPKIGIGAEYYFKILGKKIKKNIKKNQPIYKKDLINFIGPLFILQNISIPFF